MKLTEPSWLSREIMLWLSQFEDHQEAYFAVQFCCPWQKCTTYKDGGFGIGARLIGGGFEVYVDDERVNYDDDHGRQRFISFQQMREAFGTGHLSTKCRVTGDPEVDQSV